MPTRPASRRPDERSARGRQQSSGGRGALPTLGSRLRHILLRVALVALLAPPLLLLLYRFVPPPITPLMLIRLGEGEGLHKDWRPLEQIAPVLAEAVVAAEDNRFCEHWGFDWPALKGEIAAWRAGEAPRGASTITMQTAKNLFLWPDRSLLRKLLEAPLTPQIELLWPKRRIIEVYLNIVELGPGIYGAEAAAQAYFGKPAADARRARGGAARGRAAEPQDLLARQAQRVARAPRAHDPHPDRPARADAGVPAPGLIGSAAICGEASSMSQPAAAILPADSGDAIDALVARARAAMTGFATADQALVDDAVRALAWALYRPEHAQELAELAVADTGLGNVADKVVKNQRKTFGTLRDLLRVRTVGVIEEDPARGIVKYAKPVGVVGAITPSTNPAATPVNKAMMALKGRNAIVIAPSPAGWRTTARAVELMRAGSPGSACRRTSCRSCRSRSTARAPRR